MSSRLETGAQFTCRVLPAWEEATNVRTPMRANTTQVLCDGARRLGQLEESEAECLSAWVSKPNSGHRLLWDFFGVLCVFFECILAPLEFMADGVADRVQPPGLAWFNRVFWTVDMVASFFTGYALANGNIVMRPSKIARRYSRTWLLPDALMIGADWMEVVVDQEAKIFRILGMIRVVRLLRLLRLKNTLSLFLERFRSERLALLLGIMQSMLAILGVAHFIACVWVGLGRASGPRGWVHLQPEQVEASNTELYVISLHWSLTNFAGTMDLAPVNAVERLFSMCTLFFGFVAASFFVSHITSNMTRLSIIVSQKATQIRTLNKYLQERSISIGLQHRIMLNAHHVMSEQQLQTPEEHVALLHHLSDQLRAELHYEIYKPVISSHPLMARLIECNVRAMQQLCHSALALVRVAEGDVLFSRGEVPDYPKMIFVESGVLAYSQKEEFELDEVEERVEAEQWVCEQVLWSDWVYHGTLCALELSRLVTLDSQKFREIMRSIQTLSMPLSTYATEFVNAQNQGVNAMDRSDIGRRKECARLVGISFPLPSTDKFGSLGQFGAFLRQRTPSIVSLASGSTPDQPRHVW